MQQILVVHEVDHSRTRVTKVAYDNENTMATPIVDNGLYNGTLQSQNLSFHTDRVPPGVVANLEELIRRSSNSK
jgi:hypothetical protein